jgi:hypothetical protein
MIRCYYTDGFPFIYFLFYFKISGYLARTLTTTLYSNLYQIYLRQIFYTIYRHEFNSLICNGKCHRKMSELQAYGILNDLVILFLWNHLSTQVVFCFKKDGKEVRRNYKLIF